MGHRKCSITKHLEIVKGNINDYHYLKRFHYRSGSLGPNAAIYTIKDSHPVRQAMSAAIGVIIYTMPAPNLEMRNIATGQIFTGLGDRRLHLQLVNKNIRCISRVIIEPRYRGLGLASWLVYETMPKIGVPIVESLAVMGKVNPFFEKAGMKAYPAKQAARSIKLIAALSMVGVEQEDFLEPIEVHAALSGLYSPESDFIEKQIASYLQAYGKRKDMPIGIERTRYVLRSLSDRPVYYIWQNG